MTMIVLVFVEAKANEKEQRVLSISLNGDGPSALTQH
jgi:hypothetical protein